MAIYYLDGHIVNKAGEKPILVKASVGGKQFKTTIGYSITPLSWDTEKQRAREGTRKNPVMTAKGVTAADINARISKIEIAFAQLDKTPGTPLEAYRQTLSTITGNARKKGEAAAPNDLFFRYEEFKHEEARGQQWTPSTLLCWETFRRHFAAFIDARFKRPIDFPDLTERTLEAYVSFLRHDLELSEKTVAKHYHYLKWFLRWAIRKQYCKEKAIERYKPKFKLVKQPVVFLTGDELKRLFNFHIPRNGERIELNGPDEGTYIKVVEDAGGMSKTRDLFCLCAFTSLRYSDMQNLKKSDISRDAITITTIKTNSTLHIPLNDYSRAILEKYKDYQDAAGHAFPRISNQKMNEYLKPLCELCGFTEPITKVHYRDGRREEITAPKWALMGTHAARRTFVCYMLSKGVPPQVVMKYTGHSDYSAMKPYIDICNADTEKAIQVFND